MLLGLLNIESSQERWVGSFEDREPRERQTDRQTETDRTQNLITQGLRFEAIACSYNLSLPSYIDNTHIKIINDTILQNGNNINLLLAIQLTVSTTRLLNVTGSITSRRRYPHCCASKLHIQTWCFITLKSYKYRPKTVQSVGTWGVGGRVRDMLLPTLHCRHHNGSAMGSGMSRY